MAQPSPVAIMSAAQKDDPMDLGPFLKEYVLNNPFTHTGSPPPPPQPAPLPLPARLPTIAPRPVVAVKSRPLVTPSPPRMSVRTGTGSSSPPVTTTTVSQIPIVAVKAITSPIVHQVAPTVHHAPPIINPAALQLAAARADGAPLPLVSLGSALGVVDTPKAHIGSNRNFAVMLRESKLPHKHIKVKKWLLENYRHVATCPNWLSSDDLLDHAHHLFADLKGSVLSRIMKVTFANCHKVINKYGYFYIGLVRRPEKKHYGDELLRMAAEAISAGRMTSDMASQVHGVSSDLLGRMVAWYDTINDPVPEDKPLEVDPDSDPDWVLSETDSESDEASANPPPPRTNLKWKLRQKARSRLLTKMKDCGARDSSPDHTWTPRNRGHVQPYTKRRPGARHRGRPPSNHLGADVHVKEEEEGWDSEGDDDTRMDCEDVSSEASLPVVAAIGSVQVKSEPVDPDYEGSSEPNNNDPALNNGVDDVKDSFQTLRHLLKEAPRAERSPCEAGSPEEASPTKQGSSIQEVGATPNPNSGCNGTSGGRSQSLNSVVDLLTMKQELQRTRDNLVTREKQNCELEMKLNRAHSEIEHLHRTVSTQETQLFDLASEFFELSNRFMKMTHKFKQALTDAKASQDHGT